MVDIFEIVPQDNVSRAGPTPFAVAAQDAGQARYQTLLSKLAANDELMADATIDWASQDDGTIEMQQSTAVVKIESDEPLVGNFADAAKAVA